MRADRVVNARLYRGNSGEMIYCRHPSYRFTHRHVVAYVTHAQFERRMLGKIFALAGGQVVEYPHAMTFAK